ncbi:MAG: thioredoxin domain-containing protein [Candidatus Peregrinibacteria bacterium]
MRSTFTRLGLIVSVALTVILPCTGFAAEDVIQLPIVTPNDHILGLRFAPVVLVTYSDFECPYCKQHYAVMMDFLRAHRREVSLVYRQYTLAYHPSALPAAKASECVASLKGNAGFWQYVDTVFTLGASKYEKAALQTGVSAKDLKACMTDPATEAKVTGQLQAIGENVIGTPTTFVVDVHTGNTLRYVGSIPTWYFEEAILKVKVPEVEPAKLSSCPAGRRRCPPEGMKRFR